MARNQPRPRRHIRPERVWLLKLAGFHYSHWRGEYVLRLVGDRLGIGPVYRVAYTGRLAAGRDPFSASR